MLALLLAAGCDRIARRVVPALTKERATWAWIEHRGGMAVKTWTVSSNQLSLTFRDTHELGVADSGVSVCAINARQQTRQIVVRMDRCVVGDFEDPGFKVTLPKPAAGTYDVVYDDSAAGFPLVAA